MKTCQESPDPPSPHMILEVIHTEVGLVGCLGLGLSRECPSKKCLSFSASQVDSGAVLEYSKDICYE